MYSLEVTWLPTDQPHSFSDFQGLLCSPGSPYKSLEGALLGIQCAREKRIPFLGTCGGFACGKQPIRLVSVHYATELFARRQEHGSKDKSGIASRQNLPEHTCHRKVLLQFRTQSCIPGAIEKRRPRDFGYRFGRRSTDCRTAWASLFSWDSIRPTGEFNEGEAAPNRPRVDASCFTTHAVSKIRKSPTLDRSTARRDSERDEIW